MGTEINRAKTLQERLEAKIQESLGDIITVDDLRGIVERGIETALFTERHVPSSDIYRSDVRKRPLVDELVEKLLQEQMKAAVDEWIETHQVDMRNIVAQAVANGAGAAILKHLDAKFEYMFQSGIQQMQQQGILPQTY